MNKERIKNGNGQNGQICISKSGQLTLLSEANMLTASLYMSRTNQVSWQIKRSQLTLQMLISLAC